jgi:hypothetical protein
MQRRASGSGDILYVGVRPLMEQKTNRVNAFSPQTVPPSTRSQTCTPIPIRRCCCFLRLHDAASLIRARPEQQQIRRRLQLSGARKIRPSASELPARLVLGHSSPHSPWARARARGKSRQIAVVSSPAPSPRGRLDEPVPPLPRAHTGTPGRLANEPRRTCGGMPRAQLSPHVPAMARRR